MKLHDLLKYDDIVIQCHDNPDADALGSGYGLYWYFKEKGKKVRFVYGGRFEIQKSNLLLMVKELDIKIDYVNELENPELLVTVDCQYGEGNVTKFEAQNIAVIDHHQVSGPLPELSEVRSNMGSCSTVVWDMLSNEGIDVNEYEKLSTALYYGLMTDTNNFTEVSHPLDRDLRDEVSYIRSMITRFRNANLSLKELEIAGNALLQYEYDEANRFSIAEAEPCDPNILGIISDMMLEVDVVDTCLIYSILPFGVKISVRSCIKEVKASELAEYITEGIGSGGGHLEKAGGFIQLELLSKAMEEDKPSPEKIEEFIFSRMKAYFDGTEIIYAGEKEADVSSMIKVHKKSFSLGYVEAKDVVAVDTFVSVRTLEGDVDINVEEDTYIMIGIGGEIYPIKKEKFESSYVVSDEEFIYTGEYEPSIKNLENGKKISLVPYAKACISTGKSTVYVQQLDHRVKVFSTWDREKYYLGKPGDYLAVRTDDLSDIYIIEKNIYEKTYEID